LEFNFPQMHGALAGFVRRIETLGAYRFNAVISEPPVKFEFTTWLSGEEIIAASKSFKWVIRNCSRGLFSKAEHYLKSPIYSALNDFAMQVLEMRIIEPSLAHNLIG
jgi:hypothetical protein